jgi:hypothetical protein
MTTEQQRFISNMRAAVQQLAVAADALRTMHGVALARGYEQWDDADLDGTGYTANDLLVMLYLAGDVDAFLNNGAPAQTTRWPTINRYRGDL